MRVLDYVLYITHSFLSIARKLNNKDIEEKVKNTLAIMVFLISLLLFAIIYGLGISVNLISYNKPAIFVFGIGLFFLIRNLIYMRYKTNYNEVVETLKKQFSYNNKRVVFSFLLLWFISIFLLWIGVIILRQFIFHS